MHLHATSPAARRFYAALANGHGLKASARAAGIHSAVGFRLLRERFVALRDEGLSLAQAQQRLGFTSSLMPDWDAARASRGDGRHHLRRPAAVEEVFWTAFDAGTPLDAACAAAGVSRSTGYRWLQARYPALRREGLSASATARRLRLTSVRSARWEQDWLSTQASDQAHQRAQRRAAIAAAATSVTQLRYPPGVKDRSTIDARLTTRHQQYWTLMRQGLTNTAACKILGVSRTTGKKIRAAGHWQTAAPTTATTATSDDGSLQIGDLITTTPLTTPLTRPLTTPLTRPPGRYLCLRERLLLADLLALGESLRAIAAHLGRAPSTISRELARHRDAHGRYLPHLADHTATQQRRRPRPVKLAANQRLRRLVQRKLNRYWSPEQIAGWLHAHHPDDLSRRVCTESIYRALLVPGAQVLHRRYTARLRTGRALRRSRFLSRAGCSATVQNKTMIDQRPAVVDERVQAGHGEGDLIIGAGSTSAMITLRERVTHYGLIINLPGDHTSATVTAELTAAFKAMPAGLARTLTWDQGAEMAAHLAFTAATGVPVYFAGRSSPWQRGANENFNGLIRQYLPKNTDLSVHSHQHVAAVTRELNTRPRKSLDYQTPAARFRQAKNAA